MLKDENLVRRYENNPILSKKDIPYHATCIYNAGVIKYKGKYYMLFRNDYQGTPAINKIGTAGINIGLATSDDGIYWKSDTKPHFWAKEKDTLMYDPRLQVIDDEIYICFAYTTPHGIQGGIAKTDETFTKFELQTLTAPDNRNMVLFPEKINGKYVRLERPFPVYSRCGDYFDIWISESPDMKYWGNTRLLLGAENIPFCNNKIGPGTPPIKTKYGWLALFHSVELDPTLGKNGWEDKWQKIYYAGVMLLDLNDPSKVLGYCKKPLMAPSAPYEVENGLRNNVIFPGGLILEDNQQDVKIYYGAADIVECLAFSTVDELVKLCLENK